MDSRIRIFSNRSEESYSKFKLGDKTYEVMTEDLGTSKAVVITKIYLKGEILSTATSDYAHLTRIPDLSVRIMSIMKTQHKSAVEAFIKEHTKPPKSKADCAQEIRQNLRSRDLKAALASARVALESFPSDPLFLSYCGYLIAVVENKSREGTSKCEKALDLLRDSESPDMFYFLPLFCLNLGRAYMAASKKEQAISTFSDGLKYDPKNKDLLRELKALGIRRKPVIPFLERSNPINKYLGKLRHELLKQNSSSGRMLQIL